MYVRRRLRLVEDLCWLIFDVPNEQQILVTIIINSYVCEMVGVYKITLKDGENCLIGQMILRSNTDLSFNMWKDGAQYTTVSLMGLIVLQTR